MDKAQDQKYMNTNVTLGTGEIVWLRPAGASWERNDRGCNHSSSYACENGPHETIGLYEIVHGESAPDEPVSSAEGAEYTEKNWTPEEVLTRPYPDDIIITSAMVIVTGIGSDGEPVMITRRDTINSWWTQRGMLEAFLDDLKSSSSFSEDSG